jgi:hypothetical protein
MHLDQRIGRWKVTLILDFSKFLSETFLTFGIHDYVEMMVRKPNKSWRKFKVKNFPEIM